MNKRRGTDDLRIPLHEEQARVARRSVERGRLRIDKVVSERKALVDELLAQEDVEVERVAVGRAVAAPPPAREEGDVLVIPLLEEALVVERRLILREEIRVRRIRSTVRHREEIPLRTEEARVTRIPAGQGSGGADEGRPDQVISDHQSNDKEQ